MPTLKNPRHERFAQLLASGVDATNAHEQAGFTRNSGNACELKGDERIEKRVTELLTDRATIHRDATQKAVERAGLTKEWVLGRLVENVERALQARPVVDSEGVPTGEYRYEGNVANRALELLGKEQGMFIDRKESGAPGDFANMQSADEVLELVRRELGEDTARALAGVLGKHEEREAAAPAAEVQAAQAEAIEATHEAGETLN